MDETTQRFKASLWQFYETQGRHDLPWRIPEADGGFDAYKIMVSEIMLQQTQVGRVIGKYYQFLDRFPDVHSLAAAPLGDVLTLWSGLGYNRRAKFLQQAAAAVVQNFGGKVPAVTVELVALPGIGANTAGAILAYAFNRPAVFIETNIRTVYIHHFFQGKPLVADADIRPYIEATIDAQNPRLFYWALMDYGSALKKTAGNAASRSKHYSRQSPFQGSLRQIRGAVIRQLTAGPQTLAQLQQAINDSRLALALQALTEEGMIIKTSKLYYLSN